MTDPPTIPAIPAIPAIPEPPTHPAPPPFNPKEALVIISSYPDGMANIRLMAWLFESGFKGERIMRHSWRDIIVAYNRAINRIALPSNAEWFVFADKDLSPSLATTPFLSGETDIVGVQYPVIDDASWGDPKRIHTGLWRCHRTVLETVKPPWFMNVYSENGCAMIHCCCEFFRQKAEKCGFSISRAGYAGHKIRTGEL